MAKRNELLTIKPSMIKWNGEFVPLASLTPEQRAQKREEYTRRIEATVNLWCASHPEDFEAIYNYKGKEEVS